MNKNSGGFTLLLPIIIVLIIIGSVGLVFYQNYQSEDLSQQPTSERAREIQNIEIGDPDEVDSTKTDISGDTENESEASEKIKDNEVQNEEGFDWTETNIMGRGIVFSYPEGWHVASYDPRNAPLGKNEILVSETPVVVHSTHGPISNFVFTVQNGLSDPEDEFNELYEEEKSRLEDINEEVLSNKYFKKIYHLRGTVSGEGILGGTEVNKYFFITDNPEYKELSDKSNLDILTASGEPGNLLKEMVMSFKYCSYTTCQDELN